MTDLGFDDEFMATMLGDFLDESQGYLGRLNDNLLVLDGLVRNLDDGCQLKVDMELLNAMFRDAHSLKGLSAMLQLNDINNVTHRIENVFDAARRDSLGFTRDLTDLMFQAVDRLTGMVNHLRHPEQVHQEIEYQSVLDRLQRIVESQQFDAPAAMSNVFDETDIPEKYIAIFIDETEQALDQLSEVLLDEDAVDVNLLLVISHRIKGAAASIGLNRAAKLAHAMEDVLQERRDSGGCLTPDTADALLASVDALRSFLEHFKRGETDATCFDAAYPMLQALGSDRSSAIALPADRGQPAAEITMTLAETLAAALPQIAAAAPAQGRIVTGVARLDAGLPLAALKVSLIYDRLSNVGELFFANPSEQHLDDEMQIETVVFGILCNLNLDRLRQRINLGGVAEILVQVLDQTSGNPSSAPAAADTATEAVVLAPAKQAETGNTTAPVDSDTPRPLTPDPPSVSPPTSASRSNPPAQSTPAAPPETLRVDIERLDQLMNLSGQLVINRAQFQRISDQLLDLPSGNQSTQNLVNVQALLERIILDASEMKRSSVEAVLAQRVHSQLQLVKDDLAVVGHEIEQLLQARTSVIDLSEAVHQLDRLTDGIQKSVMGTRMVPVGPLFGRFKRVVRDLTRSNGKDVQLLIRGEKTELDKRMIDELADPLIHMVRNAADHGIELSETRIAAGKPARGTISLVAFHRGNCVWVQVNDDGRGLNPEQIRAKAISKGIITRPDADRLTLQQTFQLIWEPGFSTAEEITEVSGRGMGMDIVRSKIEQLKGSVELDSDEGLGTTITIKLPLTMAILPSLLTVISDDVFAIPLDSVIEIVRVSRNDISTVQGICMAHVRAKVIPMVELAELFQWHRANNPKGQPDEGRTLVIVGSDGQELALVVDDLIGEGDIVIKSLAENYRNVDGLAGASILGDGRVSLILDVPAMIAMSSRPRSSTERDDNF